MEKQLKDYLESKRKFVIDHQLDLNNKLQKLDVNSNTFYMDLSNLKFSEGYYKGQLSILEHIQGDFSLE